MLQAPPPQIDAPLKMATEALLTEIPFIPEHLHLILEGLHLLTGRVGDFEDLDRHIPVPAALEDGAKGSCANAFQESDLIGGHLPVIAGVPVAQRFLQEATVKPGLRRNQEQRQSYKEAFALVSTSSPTKPLYAHYPSTKCLLQ